MRSMNVLIAGSSLSVAVGLLGGCSAEPVDTPDRDHSVATQDTQLHKFKSSRQTELASPDGDTSLIGCRVRHYHPVPKTMRVGEIATYAAALNTTESAVLHGYIAELTCRMAVSKKDAEQHTALAGILTEAPCLILEPTTHNGLTRGICPDPA